MTYILLFVVLFAILNAYLYFAKRFNIADKPNSRSSHSSITVRGGGIIFPVGAFIWFFWSGFQFPWFFLGLGIISLISFLDDVLQLSNRIRLFIQLGSVALMFTELDLQLLPWWSWIGLLILAAGILNAYNFMDGINGITSGYSLAVLAGLWVVNNFQERFIANEFIYFIIIAVTVFSFYNFRVKAICFAGDVGSISLAFIVIFMLALLIQQTGNLIYILFLGIYGADSILTILYRLWKGENIFEAHRKHIYQLLANELKTSHLLIATIYSGLQLLICLIVYLFILNDLTDATTFIFGLGTILALMLLYVGIRYSISLKLADTKKEKFSFRN